MSDLGAPFFVHVPYPNRQRPAEYYPGRGWWQNGQPRRVKKPYYHFIWPKDGKNGGKMGRMKDIFTGKGPDIFVSISADKQDYMFNRPRKSQWSIHEQLDDRDRKPNLGYEPPWLKESRWGKKYDFGTRTYRHPDWYMWSDAHWYNVPSKKFPWPRAWRDMSGEWMQHHPNAFVEAVEQARSPRHFGFFG